MLDPGAIGTAIIWSRAEDEAAESDEERYARLEAEGRLSRSRTRGQRMNGGLAQRLQFVAQRLVHAPHGRTFGKRGSQRDVATTDSGGGWYPERVDQRPRGEA